MLQWLSVSAYLFVGKLLLKPPIPSTMPTLGELYLFLCSKPIHPSLRACASAVWLLRQAPCHIYITISLPSLEAAEFFLSEANGNSRICVQAGHYVAEDSLSFWYSCLLSPKSWHHRCEPPIPPPAPADIHRFFTTDSKLKKVWWHTWEGEAVDL